MSSRPSSRPVGGRDMIVTVILFIGAAIAIYLSCEFFVNGVEWCGQRLSVTQTATGTILAAFGTALPESVVTLMAVVFGTSDAQREIGVGAAIGGPLVLSTIAYGIVGLVLLGAAPALRRQRLPASDRRRLSRDQGWFLVIFCGGLGLGFAAFPGKHWLGLVFLLAYGLYVWRELARGGAIAQARDLAPLKIRPRDRNPALWWAALQTLGALAVIFLASHVFVGQLNQIGPWLGLSPQLAALLLAPIATELPETMNAVIWTRQGKEKLALANIGGSMMIQATVPTAIGLFGTPWLFDRALAVAAAVTVVAVMALFAIFRGGHVTGLRLSWIGLLYLVFAGTLLTVRYW